MNRKLSSIPLALGAALMTREAAAPLEETRQLDHTFQIEARNIDEDARTVELSFSSESPVDRWFGVEILDHSNGAVRLGRLNNGGALLLEHDRRRQIGVVENARIDSDGRGRAMVRFGRGAEAQEIFDDVKDGIRRLVSVGYRIHKTETTQNGGGVETVRVTDWEPYELSIVSIPADESVGVGRSDSNENTAEQQPTSSNEMNREQIIAALRAAGIAFDESASTEALRALLPDQSRNADNGTSSHGGGTSPTTQTRSNEGNVPAPSVQVVREQPQGPSAEQAIANERARIASITQIGESAERQGVTVDVRDAINSGMSAEDFRAQAFDALVSSQRSYSPNGTGERSRQEQRDLAGFSIVRGLQAVMQGRQLDGLEGEMHREAEIEAQRCGIRLEGNFHIPSMVLNSGRRDMTATGGTGGNQGGTFIETTNGSFIDLLYAKMVFRQLGAQYLTGLTGNIDLPKLVTGSTISGKGENEAADESSPTTGAVQLAPNRCTTFVELSNQLLIQNSPSIEAMVRNDLASSQALYLENHAIAHILANATGSVEGGTNGAAPTWDHIVDLETAVATANADIASLAYLTNAKVRGKLKKTFVDSGSNAERVWDKGSEPLNGYGAAVTTQVPSNLTKGTANSVCSALIFGNFSDLIIAQWGGLSIMANPYIKDTEGLTRVTLNSYHDSAIRRGVSFATMQDALTA